MAPTPPEAELTRRVSAALEEYIAAGQTPGGVALVGEGADVLCQVAVGHRMLQPERRPMEPDTLFDLASLTKPLATAPAVCDLAARGLLTPADPVCHYLPGFRGDGREAVTVAHLLTHTSGLPAYRNYLDALGETAPRADRRPRVVADICALPLSAPPGAHFEYSCLGYVLLASVVEVVSGQPLDTFCAERIHGPLGLRGLCFNPPSQTHERCAATEPQPEGPLVGVVHDETARFLNGVGGNAGLFGTAQDVARFARAVLNWREVPFFQAPDGSDGLSPLVPRSHLEGGVRTWGWDMESPYTPQVRGPVFPPGGVGHSGFTGTSVWVDPASRRYVVLLTNRVHLGRSADISGLRQRTADLAATA
jgi:CubicO group peptidase (beta-lactamase class C family)